MINNNFFKNYVYLYFDDHNYDYFEYLLFLLFYLLFNIRNNFFWVSILEYYKNFLYIKFLDITFNFNKFIYRKFFNFPSYIDMPTSIYFVGRKRINLFISGILVFVLVLF